MAARRRRAAAPAPPRLKYRTVIEGEVTVDEADGVVVWDYIPNEASSMPAHGFAGGGIIDAQLAGRRVRITIEEL